MAKQRRRPRKREHRVVQAQLSLYLDGRLAPEQRSRVEAHLDACSSCQQELRTLRWTRDLLREMPSVPLPRSFVVREADVAPRRRARWQPLFVAQWATAVVAMLLVLVLVGDVFTGRMIQVGAPRAAMEVEHEQVTVEAVERESEPMLAVVPGTLMPSMTGTLPEDAVPGVEEQVTEPPRAAEPMAVETDEGVTSTLGAPPMAMKAVSPEAERMIKAMPVTPLPAETVPPPPTGGGRGEAPVEDTAKRGEVGVQRTASAEPTAEVPQAVVSVMATATPERAATRPSAEWGHERRVLRTWALTPRAVWRWIELGLGAVLVGLIGALLWLRRR